jgi:hypothetical protein
MSEIISTSDERAKDAKLNQDYNQPVLALRLSLESQLRARNLSSFITHHSFAAPSASRIHILRLSKAHLTTRPIKTDMHKPRSQAAQPLTPAHHHGAH